MPNEKQVSWPKRLKAMRIELKPNFYREGYCEFLIVIYGEEFEKIAMNEVVETEHFKSIGEYAFESLVRKFRSQMGWAEREKSK